MPSMAVGFTLRMLLGPTADEVDRMLANLFRPSPAVPSDPVGRGERSRAEAWIGSRTATDACWIDLGETAERAGLDRARSIAGGERGAVASAEARSVHHLRGTAPVFPQPCRREA